MSDLKKGQKVTASTIGGARNVRGTISNVTKARNGEWIEIKPDDKSELPFRTRPGWVRPA